MKWTAIAAVVLVASGVSTARSMEPSSSHAVVFSAPDGLVTLELDLQIEGRSPEASWQKFLGHLFDYFERDADGSLDEAECARLPALPLLEKKELSLSRLVLERGKNGRVTPSELKRYCLEQGFAPVVIVHEPPSSADNVLSVLFHEWLDDNRDEKIDLGELERMARTMSRYDLDEDGEVSHDELLASGIGKSFPATPPVHEPSNRGEASLRIRINLDDVHPSIRLAEEASRDVAGARSASSLTRITGAKHAWMLTLDPRCRTPDIRSAGAFLVAQFQQVAGTRQDLSLPEIQRNGSLSALAELAPRADRDGDLRLTVAELESYSSLVNAALRAQIWITVADQAGNLFSTLDTNSDGRLAVVELTAAKQMFGLDASTSTVPRQFRIDFGVAPIRSWGGMQIPALPKRVATLTESRTAGPKWFQALDRNRDGIVSEREFIGRPEAFQRLDANGDGMLTTEEAESFAARAEASR